jgi:hypothetical protein
MMNMANGGMGGGVASALARALGGGRHDDARALVLHALLLGVGCAWSSPSSPGPALPAVLAGWAARRGVCARRSAFSSMSGSAARSCCGSARSSRPCCAAAGNAARPSRIGVVMSLVYIPLLGVLTLGVGDWPGLGLVGGAIAPLITRRRSIVAAGAARARGRSASCRAARRPPAAAAVREILRVGAMGSITTITATLTAMLVTGLVGRFGTAALAGYSIGMRLEFMLAPLAFGIGTGATTLVGIAAGAGAWARAVRVAWTGGTDRRRRDRRDRRDDRADARDVVAPVRVGPAVIAASVACIVHVAPFYCLFGLGLTSELREPGGGPA